MNAIRLLFPVLDLTIETEFSQEDAMAAIAGQVQPRAGVWEHLSRKYDRPYIGACQGRSIQIHRAIRYRNSFLPYISGEFVPGLGTTLKIRMSVRPGVMVFGGFWLAFVVLFLTVVARGWRGQQDMPGALMGAGMIAFYVALSNLAFWPEARIAERFLLNTLNGRIVK